MFIELADHLRCPEGHAEAYLVMLPERTEERSVRSGHLGCPVCGRTFQVIDGVVDVGGGPPPFSATPGRTPLTAEAVLALSGLHGPGGYLVLVGTAGAEWSAIAEGLPGVGIVAVNPEPILRDDGRLSVLLGGLIPLKRSSMRGVVLGEGYGESEYWIAEAARVTLPGLRVMGIGEDPPSGTVDLMASAEGVWVGAGARTRL